MEIEKEEIQNYEGKKILLCGNHEKIDEDMSLLRHDDFLILSKYDLSGGLTSG